ncbi:MAG: GGDEF domain-containing protein [Paracoccaceae bacterium]
MFATIKRIDELGLDPTPGVFTVIHECVSDPDSAIAKELELRISSGRAVTEGYLGELHAGHFPDLSAAEAYRKVGSGLSRQVSSVQKILDTGIRHGAEISHEVSGIATTLGKSESRQAVLKYAGELQGSNRALLESMNRMRTGLTRAHSDVSRLRQELEQVRRNANTDHLTSLANRRRLDEFLLQQMASSDPADNPLSFVLIDIDRFKMVNDSFGHDVGDNILKHYAALLQRNTKGKDLAARFGGEEFCLVLPNTDIAGAEKIADIIRQSFENCRWISRRDGRDIGTVTASFGAAQFRPGEGAEQLMKRADLALYAAKEAGRNRVVCER